MRTTPNLFDPYRSWSWLKRLLLLVAACGFIGSSFLFLTPTGASIRIYLAKTVITTQHRDWAWILVGAQKRDELVAEVQALTEKNALEKQDLNAIKYRGRSADSLVKVEDISGKLWKGKRMYVYDPTTIRVMVPSRQGEGERITSMVQRSGAVAGINGGGFVDPDGLGNGFAPIGVIMSGGSILYTDQDGSVPQHIVGFTKEGTLIIGKYTINELLKLGVTDAVSFYPRVIANGKPLITSGDGGWGRAPRTAIGQKADGTVIFIVIDGRQTHSVGATLKEVQDLFMEDGVINAGFLDGGASSEMVVDGELVTSPSSRYGERRLPSAFLVFDNPKDVKVDHIWDGLTTIDPGGAYDHPDYLREQAEKKATQPKTTATPKPSAKPTAVPEASPGAAAGGTPQASGAPGAKPGDGAGGAGSGAGAGASGGGPGQSGSTGAAPQAGSGAAGGGAATGNAAGGGATPQADGGGGTPGASASPQPSATPKAGQAGGGANAGSDTGGDPSVSGAGGSGGAGQVLQQPAANESPAGH
ncbi:phosphodiester glycosidase family protein [Paenibacillus athensensis]|uniref:phosphodiester glycosidase family protein n=1 Tax=Paenibacillus athensensis TaxID=1967502 RepID=UPI002E7758A0|nr:phosphodiester glycosidase family protein [Paenibacillus athensensis]